MISTRLVTNLWDVPREWIFEFYLTIGVKLNGESVKIKSIFNPSDKIPSMIIYFDGRSGQYKFKDFSSGYQGDAIRLVELLYNLNRDGAKAKIISDYEDYCSRSNTVVTETITAAARFKLSDFQIRHWNTNDKNYWSAYKISSSMLEAYNINPLEYYELTREKGEHEKDRMRVQRDCIYGYFKEDGTLYKIYQPKVIAKKFLKIGDYVQGYEQLRYDSKYLVLVASLKDLLCFNLLGINNIEAIAPDAESTILPKEMIERLKDKYSRVFVLFDNDETGRRYSIRYHDEYGFTPIYLKSDKDIADAVKNQGVESTRDIIFNLFRDELVVSRTGI
jgi:hypothetical protein